MTTFDIDNTKKTKHREVLESLVEQAHALQSIHNPNTWRLSALTYALHLHDCFILFGQLKEKWAQRLPFSEAWDVDFTVWKTRIWSLVNNVSSFTEDGAFNNWQRLCEDDYCTFLKKASNCLAGDIPLKELTDFLSEKNTELKKVIMDSGQDLSTLFSDIEDMLYNSDSILYENFYNDLAKIYMKENANPYQIDDNGVPIPYERWKASKSRKRLPDLLLSKTKSANTTMLEIKFWQETWSECFDFEKREIDKEGFARFIFQNRKSIIESKTYPCKNCLGKCFAALCLCEHLWEEHNSMSNPEVNADILKSKIMPDIKALEEYVKDEYKAVYPSLWNRIFEDSDILKKMKDKNPNTFNGGYNQKLICNIIGLMSNKGLFTISKKKIDDNVLYSGKTVYKYLNEISGGSNTSALTEKTKRYINNILDNL